MDFNRLPPLAAVRVFDAAARLASFTHAATELGMTQAAVSYQIKVLEERVGGPLFLRQARGVQLTPVGAALAERVGGALQTIVEAYAEARGETQGRLAISATPTFATNFLARRLGRFQMSHPQLSVRIEVSESPANFRNAGIDVAIRGGGGNWPGLISHRLMPIEFTPMLSPQLAESIGGIHRPRDLLDLPILAHGYPWWAKWFEAAGVNYQEPVHKHPAQFGPQILEGNAAMAGEGVAMLMPALFAEALARGDLLQPFELTCADDDAAYWLVYPESLKNAPKVKAFKGWLMGEISVGSID